MRKEIEEINVKNSDLKLKLDESNKEKILISIKFLFLQNSQLKWQLLDRQKEIMTV